MGLSSFLRTGQSRRRPRLNQPAFEVTYQIANQIELVAASLQLVYTAYRRRGLIRSNISGLRVTPFHLHPKTEVLVAIRGGHVLGTTTLIYDNAELGLPIDRSYAPETARKRACGFTLAEASCLANTSDPPMPLQILLRLMAFTIQCASRRGVAELLALVHPHHADFYTKFLGFEVFGDVRPCVAVRNHPAVALALELRGLSQRDPRAHRRVFGPRFPARHLGPAPLSAEIRDFLAYRLEGPLPS